MAQAPHPDLAATPPGQDAGAASAMPAGGSLEIPLGVRLDFLCAGGGRFSDMDRLESYYRARQDDHKMYDWDGKMMGFDKDAPIAPGWVVPYASRKPCARYDLARVIVHRFTSMLFGTDRFPEIRIEGDDEAEDYAKALATEANLALRLIEVRNLGGATGTACASFCFYDGRPRVEAHNAKHVTVLRWADEQMKRPAAVLKAYAYPRRIFDRESGKLKDVTFYYARYWDEFKEILWAPIPENVAKTPNWPFVVPSETSVHDFGFCPFYWVQNLPDSIDQDGEGDYEGMTDLFDQINQVLSATVKGTKANVDPTLVIKMDPALADGKVFKGSENALFSPNGADYLELSGQAVAAGTAMVKELRACALERASVVIPDDEKKGGGNESASHLRLKFAPMLAQCDILREQYGEQMIKPMVGDMLRAAKAILERPEEPIFDPDGKIIEMRKPSVVLPPRRIPVEEGSEELKAVDRSPGDSEEIVLNWNPYFPPTWDDISKAATATMAANGGKPVISQRTSVQVVQSLFGVNDVDAEMQRIEAETDAALAKAQEAFGDEGSGPRPPFASDEKDEDDEAAE